MVLLLALAVGLVLADSSVVTLALPDVLRELDTTVGTVAWVLIAFNLALALAALPGSRLARGRERGAYAAALVLFALASAACAAAPSMAVLIAARAAQGVFGAVVVAAALHLLAARVGGRRAVALWAGAGVLGAAVGPALGGFLTEAFSWEAMFALQAPVALVALLGARGAAQIAPAAAPGAGERPPLAPLVALALLSAALAAALFLLVVLIIEGWQHSPAVAAVTVTLMPVAALLAARWARDREGLTLALAGCVLVAGGLAALGLLPGAGPVWTLAPQLAIGAGLGLALAPLVRVTVGGSGDHAPDEPAAWTICARHAGIVAGLLILTPIFTAGLDHARVPAERAGVARLLDAPLSLSTKVDLARTLGAQVASADNRLPDLRRGFDALKVSAAERPAAARLQADLDDELDRAGTDAFSTAFLAAALLALLAAGVAGLAIRSARAAGVADGAREANGSHLTPGAPLATAVSGSAALAALLIAVYVALGGGSYRPHAVANPCASRARPAVGATQRAVLAALDGGACKLHISREALLLPLLEGKRPPGVSDDELADALRSGVDRAQDEGALSGLAATALKLALSTRGTAAILGLLLDAG
jgi:predicted MFS family arabinose efflux permease